MNPDDIVSSHDINEDMLIPDLGQNDVPMPDNQDLNTDSGNNGGRHRIIREESERDGELHRGQK